MITDANVLHLAKANREFQTVMISTVGYNPTSEDDFKEPENVASISCKWNAETIEHDFFGDPGKSTSKASTAPSIDLEMVWSDGDVQRYLATAAPKLGYEGCTQVKAISFTGEYIYFIANVVAENFGIDGAPSDDAAFKVTLSYAGGPVLIETAP